ncbi:hypothetical protein BAUCODRAFT_36736 [Baudoinia panamericana UAMH 10762]|uniref:Chromo domain-containing protein n=1 Tax=Baudoinia panamericana (strain UAMH 10762) TaxID=717646 RepID=M2N5E9_BAUPA|nr:uncharacterized protein BAUCODRAFT_36736 [Baudoinia panamericana UAMH 10762]EMC94269.1 hypothetical protein BAUCODRAFT_36736 [Baudoinia panamericana UAMH 10762]
MGAKRKLQSPAATNSRKRAKGNIPVPPASPHPHGDVDPGKFYQARKILDEDRTRYYIDWENDEVTGAAYEPTWEPKAHANRQLIDEWKRQKARGAPPPPSPIAEPVSPEPQHRKSRGRPRKVVLSSPETPSKSQRRAIPQQTEKQAQVEALPAEVTAVSEPEIVESQQAVVTAEAEKDANSPLFEPEVAISSPPSSYQAGEYQKFTSSSQAAPSSGSALLQKSSKQSYSVPVNFGESSSKVIPDSQTLVDLSSSAPAAGGVDLPAPEDSPAEALVERAPAESLTSSALVATAAGEPGLLFEDPPPPFAGAGAASASSERPAPNPEETPTAPTSFQQENALQGEQEPFAPQTDLSALSEKALSEPREQANGFLREKQEPTASGSRPQGNDETQETSSSRFQTQIPLLESDRNLQQTPHRAGPIGRSPAVTGIASSPPLNRSLNLLSPTQLSSPLASVPIYSIRTIGESAPIRPSTPSSFMSTSPLRLASAAKMSSQESKASLSAKLKAIRAPKLHQNGMSVLSQDSRAVETSASSHDAHTSPLPPKLVASLELLDQDRRSPSAVPAVPPNPVITQQEMNTSERYETLLPGLDVPRTTAVPPSGPASQYPPRPDNPINTTASHDNHVVPIALLGHQRDQYSATMKYEKALIEQFLAATNPDPELVSRVESLVARMLQVTLHPDLANAEALTQYDLEPTQHAQWSIDCSSKFRFLKALLDGLRDQTLHILVVTPPDKTLDILDVFLTGITVRHRRVDAITEASLSIEHEGLMVTILSTADRAPIQPSPADLVVALEPTISAASLANLVESSDPTTCVTLIVPFSIEHIEMSISAAIEGTARLRTLISAVQQYRDDAGRLGEHQLKPDAAGNALAEWLARGNTGAEWPLANLSPLPSLDSQTESDADRGDIEGTDYVVNVGAKRPFDAADINAPGDAITNKKARSDGIVVLTATSDALPATINPQDIEITHISDSVTKPTQSKTTMSETENRLRDLLQHAQDRLEEHVQALSELQYRHEEQRQRLIEITKENGSAVETARRAIASFSDASDKVSALKVQRTELQLQLEEANAKLLNHTVPERAEFEALRLAAQKAVAEKVAFEKRLETANGELDYLRGMYQTSSQSAQGLATQVTELEKSLAVATNRATGEQVKLRQMGYDAQTKGLRAENKKLKALLHDREASIKFRDEEIAKLKEASRGRMGTRATSVPRSPRLGSPLKFNGSRQASPAVGEHKARNGGHLHPLRNG